MRAETKNIFNQGLNKDLNPLTTPNNVVTDCINGSFITFNGDEMAIQNDSGNGKINATYVSESFLTNTSYLKNQIIEYNNNYYVVNNNIKSSVTPDNDTTNYTIINSYVKLTDGYHPIGMKEFGGVLYIVSSNGTNIEFGSYPSPQYVGEEINNGNGFNISLNNISDLLYKPQIINSDNFQAGDYIMFNGTIDLSYITDISTTRFYKIKLYHILDNGSLDITDDIWTKYKTANTGGKHWINDTSFKYYCPTRYKGTLAISVELEDLSKFSINSISNLSLYNGYCLKLSNYNADVFVYHGSQLVDIVQNTTNYYYTTIGSSVILEEGDMLYKNGEIKTLSSYANNSDGTTINIVFASAPGWSVGDPITIISSNGAIHTSITSISGASINVTGNLASGVTLSKTDVIKGTYIKDIDTDEAVINNFKLSIDLSTLKNGMVSCRSIYVQAYDNDVEMSRFTISKEEGDTTQDFNFDLIIPNWYSNENITFTIKPDIDVNFDPTLDSNPNAYYYLHSDNSINILPTSYVNQYTISGTQYISNKFDSIKCNPLYGECDYTTQTETYNMIYVSDNSNNFINPLDLSIDTGSKFYCITKSGYTIPSTVSGNYTVFGTYTISNGFPVVTYTLDGVSDILKQMLSNTAISYASNICTASLFTINFYHPNSNETYAYNIEQNGSSQGRTGITTTDQVRLLSDVEADMNMNTSNGYTYSNTMFKFIPSKYPNGISFLPYMDFSSLERGTTTKSGTLVTQSIIAKYTLIVPSVYSLGDSITIYARVKSTDDIVNNPDNTGILYSIVLSKTADNTYYGTQTFTIQYSDYSSSSFGTTKKQWNLNVDSIVAATGYTKLTSDTSTDWTIYSNVDSLSDMYKHNASGLIFQSENMEISGSYYSTNQIN